MDSKLAKKEARKEATQKLSKICAVLEEHHGKCKLLLHQLRTKTKDTIHSIERYFNSYDSGKDYSSANTSSADRDKQRYLCLRHFLKQWFTSFLAFKDEAMVLFTGELCRPYHAVEHKEFIHVRGKQSSYYKGSGVSACSVDGWRYEFNQTLANLGRSDSLEMCAERCDTVSDSLEDIITAMDACGEQMHSALRSLKPQPISVQAEFRSKSNKHMAEVFRVELAVDSGAGAQQKPKVVSLSRSDAQNISRREGLSTVLEDLPRTDVPAVAASAPPALNVTASLRRKVIVTEEDLEQEAEETQRRQREAKKLEEQINAQKSSFSMKTVSLDAVKRSLGRTRILSTVNQHSIGDEELKFRNRSAAEAEEYESSDEDVDVDTHSAAMDVENHATSAVGGKGADGQATGSSLGRAQGESQSSSRASNSHANALRAIRKGKTCTVATPHPGLPPPKVRTLKLYVQVPACLQDSSETQLYGVGGIEMYIEVTWGDGWDSEISSVDQPRFVSASEILDEAFRQLWSFTAADEQQAPWPLFPRALTLVSGASSSSAKGASTESGGKIFTRGEVLQLPAENQTLQVLCESDTQFCDTLMSIAAAVKAAFVERAERHKAAAIDPLNSNAERRGEGEQSNQASREVAEQIELLEAARLAEPIVPDSLLLARWLQAVKSLTETRAMHLNLSQLSSVLYHQENTVFFLLQQIDALRERPGALTKLHVDLSGTDVCGTLLVEFMRCSTHVVAKNCSLDAYELRACAAVLESTSVAFDDIEDLELTALGKRAHGTAVPAGPIASVPQLHLPDAIPLESVTLDSNLLFASFGDAAKIPPGPEGTVSALRWPPLDTFFSALFLSAPSLASLDVSHCCSLKPRGQALALCTAILRAARLRTEAGLPPLQRLSVRGLRSLVSQSRDTKYAIDVDEGFIQPLLVAMQGCAVDVGGVNRSL